MISSASSTTGISTQNQSASMLFREVNWYDAKGGILGSGNLHAADVRRALEAAQSRNPDLPYVIVLPTREACDPFPRSERRNADALLRMSPLIFGKTDNYFVLVVAELKKGMVDTIEHRGFTFRVVTQEEAKKIICEKT